MTCALLLLLVTFLHCINLCAPLSVAVSLKRGQTPLLVPIPLSFFPPRGAEREELYLNSGIEGCGSGAQGATNPRGGARPGAVRGAGAARAAGAVAGAGPVPARLL